MSAVTRRVQLHIYGNVYVADVDFYPDDTKEAVLVRLNRVDRAVQASLCAVKLSLTKGGDQLVRGFSLLDADRELHATYKRLSYSDHRMVQARRLVPAPPVDVSAAVAAAPNQYLFYPDAATNLEQEDNPYIPDTTPTPTAGQIPSRVFSAAADETESFEEDALDQSPSTTDDEAPTQRAPPDPDSDPIEVVPESQPLFDSPFPESPFGSIVLVPDSQPPPALQPPVAPMQTDDDGDVTEEEETGYSTSPDLFPTFERQPEPTFARLDPYIEFMRGLKDARDLRVVVVSGDGVASLKRPAAIPFDAEYQVNADIASLQRYDDVAQSYLEHHRAELNDVQRLIQTLSPDLVSWVTRSVENTQERLFGVDGSPLPHVAVHGMANETVPAAAPRMPTRPAAGPVKGKKRQRPEDLLPELPTETIRRYTAEQVEAELRSHGNAQDLFLDFDDPLVPNVRHTNEPQVRAKIRQSYLLAKMMEINQEQPNVLIIFDDNAPRGSDSAAMLRQLVTAVQENFGWVFRFKRPASENTQEIFVDGSPEAFARYLAESLYGGFQTYKPRTKLIPLYAHMKSTYYFGRGWGPHGAVQVTAVGAPKVGFRYSYEDVLQMLYVGQMTRATVGIRQVWSTVSITLAGIGKEYNRALLKNPVFEVFKANHLFDPVARATRDSSGRLVDEAGKEIDGAFRDALFVYNG